ncbi:hypothetical protein DRP04_11980 [Archaeoglobales archaeon]|nr:MAG: hypothetical protein DRP04_11980 [Archaeoglobales archaeon]
MNTSNNTLNNTLGINFSTTFFSCRCKACRKTPFPSHILPVIFREDDVLINSVTLDKRTAEKLTNKLVEWLETKGLFEVVYPCKCRTCKSEVQFLHKLRITSTEDSVVIDSVELEEEDVERLVDLLIKWLEGIIQLGEPI